MGRRGQQGKPNRIGAAVVVGVGVGVLALAAAWLMFGTDEATGPSPDELIRHDAFELARPELPAPHDEVPGTATPITVPAEKPEAVAQAPQRVHLSIRGDAWGVHFVQLTQMAKAAHWVALQQDEDLGWVGDVDWRGPTTVFIENNLGVTGYVLEVIDIVDGVTDYRARMPLSNLFVRIEPEMNPHSMFIELARMGPLLENEKSPHVVIRERYDPDAELVLKQMPEGHYLAWARYAGQSKARDQIPGLERDAIIGLGEVTVVDQNRPVILELIVDPVPVDLRILDGQGRPINRAFAWFTPAGPEPIPSLPASARSDAQGKARLVLPKGVPGTIAVYRDTQARNAVGYVQYEGWAMGAKDVRLQPVVPVALTTKMPLTKRTRGPGLLRLHGRGSGFGGLFEQRREAARRTYLTPGHWTATVSWPDGRRSLSADFEVPESGGAVTVELVHDDEDDEP